MENCAVFLTLFFLIYNNSYSTLKKQLRVRLIFLDLRPREKVIVFFNIINKLTW